MKQSDAMAAYAEQLRRREQREAVAGWLRKLADKISPDQTYMPVRGRLWLGRSGLEFEYTPAPLTEPDNVGVPVFIRSADRVRVVRR